MDSTSGMGSSLYLGAGALKIHSVGMQVAAHNVANISTDNFTPQRALYATGSHGNGVELDAVLAERMAMATEPESAPITEDNIGNIVNSILSGTKLAEEIPAMITTQRAFEANAQTISAADEMFGYTLNLKA